MRSDFNHIFLIIILGFFCLQCGQDLTGPVRATGPNIPSDNGDVPGPANGQSNDPDESETPSGPKPDATPPPSALQGFNESCHTDDECADGLACTCQGRDNCDFGRCRVACAPNDTKQNNCEEGYFCASNFCYNLDEIKQALGNMNFKPKKPILDPDKIPRKPDVSFPIEPKPQDPPVDDEEREEEKEEPAPTAVPNNVQAIFSAKCQGCHNPDGVAAGTGLFLTDAVTSFQKLVDVASKKTPALKRVFPGDPDLSQLVDRLESGEMPLGGAKLPQSDINAIRQWIEGLE